MERVVGELRIVPEAVGTSPRNPSDHHRKGPPFVLMPEQVAVLVEYVIKDESAYDTIEFPDFPTDTAFRLRLTTFRDLWRRGYYLTNGLKFGCDYLFLFIKNFCKTATQVKKQSVLAIVAPDSFTPYYIQCCWWKSHEKVKTNL
ncbi:unnamed protein product [Dracunculus medinensis]|uniref:tRNA-intron lyase n=1 Tax=Dracunculus medinensis TaxID=318479 RepID=A0A0N4UK93_DRAME|nr:unnamed protein product [Dracunculus medinensis]